MVPNSPFPVRPNPPSRLPSSSTYLASYPSADPLPQLQAHPCTSAPAALLHSVQLHAQPLLHLCASALSAPLLHLSPVPSKVFHPTYQSASSTQTSPRGPDTALSPLPIYRVAEYISVRGPHIYPTLPLQVHGDHLELMPPSMPAVEEQDSQGSFGNFSDLMPGKIDNTPGTAHHFGMATAEQDAEAQMEAQLQHVLFGSSRSEDAGAGGEPQGEPPGGPPPWEGQGGPPGGFAAKPPGESLPTSLRLDDDFADALLAASTGELGGDLTSSGEVSHVTCVAEESLDIRYSGLGSYPSLLSRTSPTAVTSEGMRSMLKGVAPSPQLIKGFAPAEEEASEVPECATCWGAQLHFNGDAVCTPDFVPGKLHFKNKFCNNCKEGILVPLAQVRAASTELAACFVNKRSEGFWNSAPKSMGGGQYRILNNTAGSIGPWIALFRDQPPAFNWPAISRLKLNP